LKLLSDNQQRQNMKSTIEKFGSGMHYFRVDSVKASSKKRFICSINSQIDFHCALMPKKEGGFYINVGSKIIKQLKLSVGDLISYKLKEDTSAYQFKYPEELEEVLNTDEAAKTIFESLTDGNKRGLMYLVNQVKSVDKKIERSLKIAEKLKLGITSPRLIMKK